MLVYHGDAEICQWTAKLLRESKIPINIHASSPGAKGCHLIGEVKIAFI